jgi:hypothetical protein
LETGADSVTINDVLVGSPQTVPSYSAVAFFFALKLHQELGVPVGVLKTAWVTSRWRPSPTARL